MNTSLGFDTEFPNELSDLLDTFDLGLAYPAIKHHLNGATSCAALASGACTEAHLVERCGVPKQTAKKLLRKADSLTKVLIYP